MKKRPLPSSAKHSKPASIANTIARVSGLASRALEPSDEDVVRLLALEAARRPFVGAAAAAPAVGAAAKPNINKQFLANTIRSVSSHNRREEEAECWRAHGAQKRMEARARPSRSRSGDRDRKRRRSRSRSRSGSRGEEKRSPGGETGWGHHVPLRAPPAPRVVREREPETVVTGRWERGVALSPPRGGVVAAVNAGPDDALVSAASSSSSSPPSSSSLSERRRRKSKGKKKKKSKSKKKHAKKKKHSKK